MYLNKFHIKNFRCIKEIDLEFKAGLNVLIGENNTGKSSIIDALRICLSYGGIRRDIYVQPEDFFIDSDGRESTDIEFDLVFGSPSTEEQGVFIELLSLASGQPELQLHFRYQLEIKNGIERPRPKYWGGDNEGQTIPSEVMELLYFVYLGALRDAERDLRPSRGNRLSQLFLKLLREPEKQKQYANNLQVRIDADDQWKELIAQGKGKVNEHLKQITIDESNQQVDIRFVHREFRRIVEDLKMQLPFPSGDGNADLRFEIDQNGLGYNNLIYVATVLGDVLERKAIEKETYVAILVEEPEAHLHPQLQDVLFNFFEGVAQKDIQLFVTSHSPTVTAKTAIDSLMVLQSLKRTISSVSLRRCPLNEDNKKYLERFLDVTKCQLFFARGVILVEGISEALLLPGFCEIMGVNLEKVGVEIVNIDGTAFEPFARLFNSDDTMKRMSTRAAILTDNDKDENGLLSARAQRASGLSGGNLKVFFAEKTFEYELYGAGNSTALINTYRKLHPKTEIETVDEFLAAMKRNEDKAEFSQLLAMELRKDDQQRQSFGVPQYIKEAIEWVVQENGKGTDAEAK